MTPTKIALAGAAMTVLLIMFATRPDPTPPVELVVLEKIKGTSPDVPRAIPTEPILQPAFDTPSWVPDEATKKKALLRAYHMNGGSMVGDHMIDVSQPEGIVADPGVVNELDEQADNPNWEARRRFMNRTFRATHDQLAHHDKTKSETDICKKHGLHKVVYGDKWRCRK
jgi:hypothetical protein